MNHLLSVIVPVYQVERYLNKCIDSILGQTYKNIEIILIDDGSIDSCVQICDDYANNDFRVKVIHQKNRGLSAARNTGIDLATGEYICFIDSDDYIELTMFEKMMNKIVKEKADIVICGFRRIGEQGKTIFQFEEKPWVGSGKDFVKFDGIKKNYVWNKIYRRELFDEVRFPLNKFYEDIFVMHDVFWKAKKVVTIPDKEYNYIVRSESISYNKKTFKTLDYCEGCIKRINFLFKNKASLDVIYFYIWEYFKYWKMQKNSQIKKDKQIVKKIKKLKSDFQMVIFKYIKYFPTIKKRFKFVFLALFPMLYEKIISLYSKNAENKYWKNIYKSNTLKEISDSSLKFEYKKYADYIKTGSDYDKKILKIQYKSFFQDEIYCLFDSLTLSENILDPVLVVVEKNESVRMPLFYDHYRKLGVHQFVVLDNGSTDGTVDFLINQQDTRVYQTAEKFQTHKKEAWIQRLLTIIGYNRWYIVVDADELLDYVGSEDHSIVELISRMHNNGYRRLCGLMVDMYSKDPLFSVKCNSIDIPKKFQYFDKDSYVLNLKNSSEAIRSNDEIYGGPRYRVFNMVATLSKQAIFFNGENMLYRNCHYLYPLIPWDDVPLCFVLRHYKFLFCDKAEYENRIIEKSFFDNSSEYIKIMNQIDDYSEECSLYNEESVFYNNSKSLRCLPYVEEVIW